MSGRDVVVECLQRLLAEDQASRIGGAVVQALERGTFAKQDQARGVIGQQPDVTRVTLALERGQEPGEIDE